MNNSLTQKHNVYLNLFAAQQANLSALYRQLEHLVRIHGDILQINATIEELITQTDEYFKAQTEMLVILGHLNINQYKTSHKNLIDEFRNYQLLFKVGKLKMNLLDLLAKIREKVRDQMKMMERILEKYNIEHITYKTELNVDSDLGVHISIFDIEHKNIAFILNMIEEKISNGDSKESIIELLDDLTEKFRLHFAHEERLMTMYKFPLFNAHWEEHKLFINRLTKIRKEIVAQAEPNSSFFDIEELVLEINNHIISSDKLYSSFFNNIGID